MRVTRRTAVRQIGAWRSLGRLQNILPRVIALVAVDEMLQCGERGAGGGGLGWRHNVGPPRVRQRLIRCGRAAPVGAGRRVRSGVA